MQSGGIMPRVEQTIDHGSSHISAADKADLQIPVNH
jgi:hypothetical protein